MLRNNHFSFGNRLIHFLIQRQNPSLVAVLSHGATAAPSSLPEMTHTFRYLSGSKMVALEKKIIMFPNPTNGIVNITYKDVVIKKDMSIWVYNAVGQLLKVVHSRTMINSLNVGSFPDGVYYVRITVDNSSVTKYIMKAGSERVIDNNFYALPSKRSGSTVFKVLRIQSMN